MESFSNIYEEQYGKLVICLPTQVSDLLKTGFLINI